MTIYCVEEQRRALLAALEQAESIEVDLSKVSELDTAGVQLLLSAKRTAVLRNKAFCLIEHSPAVLNVFELLNLNAYFGDPLFMKSTAEAPQ